MNNETKSDTPETNKFRASLDGMRAINQRDRLLSHARKLERERDELRTALAACMEDSIELLGERGWWKDEARSGYAQRYEQTAENIRTARGLLMNGGQV